LREAKEIVDDAKVMWYQMEVIFMQGNLGKNANIQSQ